MDTLSPIVLVSDSFKLDGNGTSFTVTPRQFANPNREPMLVDEFRFVVASSSDDIWKSFASLTANLTFGNMPLTNSNIPVAAFAPRYASVSTAIQTLVWHLPKPLYVPPNVQLGATLSRNNPFPSTWNSSPGAIFYASVAARSVPKGTPIPNKIYVPYACATSCYASTFNSTTGETTPFTSKDNEIGNPFDSSMRMSYLSGLNILPGINLPSPVGVLVQATYANGKGFIRDQTPFNLLFPAARAMLRTHGVMKPKDFLKFTLSLNPIVGADNTENDIKFTTIGMTGYREIETPSGGWLP